MHLMPDVMASNAAALSMQGDTIRMPWSADGEIPDLVVRPALAVLFRMAVGKGADFYVPKFLERESHGRFAPGWVWPAFAFPAGWAFYRKLHLAGVLFAALPFVGLAAVLAMSESFGSSEVAWWIALVMAVLVMPGLVAATVAVPLLHWQVRRNVRRAEAADERPDQVATALAAQQPTSALNAGLLGFATLALWFAVALPSIEARQDDQFVRTTIARSVAAIAPLREAVEASRAQQVALSSLASAVLAPLRLGSVGLETVAVDPKNGRLRLTFSSAAGSLAGKSLLLAPAVDAGERVRWFCVPIDIPAKQLPRDCRH